MHFMHASIFESLNNAIIAVYAIALCATGTIEIR